MVLFTCFAHLEAPQPFGNSGVVGSGTNVQIKADGSAVFAGGNINLYANGNIGIGAVPSRKLTVGGDINVASGSNIESTSSSGTLRIQGGSTYPGGNILLGGGQGTNDIRFRTTGGSTTQTERMRITSAGARLRLRQLYGR